MRRNQLESPTDDVSAAVPAMAADPRRVDGRTRLRPEIQRDPVSRGPKIMVRALWFVGAALAAVSCGQAASGANAGTGGLAGSIGAGGVGAAGGTGGQPGCVEVVVSPEAVGDPAGAWGLAALSNGVWRTPSGLHVAWIAWMGTANANSSNEPWLFLATFDAETGRLDRLRRYDMFPVGSTFDIGDIQAFSGATSDTFATSLRAWDEANHPGDQTLFLGSLADDNRRDQVALGWTAGTYDVTDIGWDGEAFAVHSRDNATGEIFVARVSPDGRLIQPQTRYGSTPSPGGVVLGYRMSTDPTSGMSYLFDAAGTGDAGLLSGHDRGADPLSWAFPSPWPVRVADINPLGGDPTDHGALAADQAGGVWTVWSQHRDIGIVGALAHVTADGQIDQSFTFESPNLSSTVNRTPPLAVRASSTDAVWIAEKVDQQIYSYELGASGVTAPRLVYTNPYLDPARPVDTFVGIADMSAVAWQRERWLVIPEFFIGGTSILHIFKLGDACVYSPAIRPQSQ